MTVRKKMSAAAIAAAMTWGAFGLASPATAAPATAQASEVSAAAIDFPTGTPKGRIPVAKLNSGDTMDENHYLASPNGQHRLAADGWLASEVGLYLSSWSSTPKEISTTGSRTDLDNLLAMQKDGNLVLYTNGKATWASHTGGNNGATAELGNDYNLVVRSSTGKVLFSTNTAASDAFSVNVLGRQWTSRLMPGWYLQSPDRYYTMAMQKDGNLVLYAGNRAIWHSGTFGNTNAFFVMQPDGNMVVYSEAGKALWGSGTARAGDHVDGLVLQPDGNAVMYTTSTTAGFPLPRAVWATNTNGQR